MISNAAGNSWVGYNRNMRPNAALHRKKDDGSSKRAMVTIPEGVYYIRGCSSDREDRPCVWVKNMALYLVNCGLNKPDLTDYTEITGLTFDQRSRAYDNGAFDKDRQDCPSIGDMFFSPAATDIILTFNNANIAPYIYAGDNFTSTSRQRVFNGHYGFGYAWYHCRTPDICCALGGVL